TNDIANDIAAVIEDAQLTAGPGGVPVTAQSAPTIKALTIGAAGAGTAAAGGSLSIDNISGSTNAHLTAVDLETAGDVRIEAMDKAVIDTIAGGVAGAGV